MGKKKDKKKKKQLEMEAQQQETQKELIPPIQTKPLVDQFTGTFTEFKKAVYALEPNSGAHYFMLPFGEIMANITTKRSLKKKGWPGPGQYTWKDCEKDFASVGGGTAAADEDADDDSVPGSLAELFDAKYKRKAFKYHLETSSEFDRETIDAVISLIPKKKATGVLLNTIMMQNLKMSATEAQKVLAALTK